MEKKMLLDCVLGARQLDEIKVRGGAGVEEFIFRDGFLLGAVVLGTDQRFRLQVSVEPQVTDLRTPDERWIENAKERVRSAWFRVAHVCGLNTGELAELSTAIDNLINARISRAMRIHEDADHDDDE